VAKILVIDDDKLVRSMVCGTLRKANHEVLEAGNGNEGVQKAQDETPDLVITDMLMPDKEGIETIIEIKAINESIKIIAISGGGNTKNMVFLEMAQKIGADHALSKPFKPNDLLGAINTLLGG